MSALLIHCLRRSACCSGPRQSCMRRFLTCATQLICCSHMSLPTCPLPAGLKGEGDQVDKALGLAGALMSVSGDSSKNGGDEAELVLSAAIQTLPSQVCVMLVLHMYHHHYAHMLAMLQATRGPWRAQICMLFCMQGAHSMSALDAQMNAHCCNQGGPHMRESPNGLAHNQVSAANPSCCHRPLSQGVIIGTDHPVLHIAGELPEMCALLLECTPPGCVLVGEKAFAAAQVGE